MTNPRDDRARSLATTQAWHAARALSAPWLQNTAIGTVERLRPKQVLYSQGDAHDCFYLVRSGFIHTTVLRSNGSRLLLEIYGAGAIFGEASAFIDRPRYVTAEAATAVVLSRYRASDIQRIAQQSPELIVALLQLLGYKHRLLIDKLATLTSSSAEDRIVDLLARIVLATPAEGAQPVRLTHEQIAAMTGVSRVTATRALGNLAEQGLVVTRSRGVEVVDPDRLLALFDAG